jgi:hypothetical protein
LFDITEFSHYGRFGAFRQGGDFFNGDPVEVEEDELFFLGGQPVDKLVEALQETVAAVVDIIFEGFGVELDENGNLSSSTVELSDGVERDTVDPCVLSTLATEFGVVHPQIVCYLLIEVADTLRTTVGEKIANPENGALALVEHHEEIFLLCFFLHLLKDMLLLTVVSPKGARQSCIAFITIRIVFSTYIRCKNAEKVSRKMIFF